MSVRKIVLSCISPYTSNPNPSNSDCESRILDPSYPIVSLLLRQEKVVKVAVVLRGKVMNV